MNRYFLYKPNKRIVYEFVRKPRVGLYLVKVLREKVILAGYAYKKDDEMALYETHLTEVTDVFKKLVKLEQELFGSFTIDDFEYVHSIKNRFIQGMYPTKVAFKKMNKLWSIYG